MNKKLLSTVWDAISVILMIVGIVYLVVITSQFVLKHEFITVGATETDITLAEILCIKVIKPRPVNTLVASQ